MNMHQGWELLHPGMTGEHLGWLPMIFSATDAASAKEQVNNRYKHGGGWTPLPKWKVNTETLIATYPGDPPYKPVAKLKLRDETIVLYPSSWVAIIQPDGSFEMSRMD